MGNPAMVLSKNNSQKKCKGKAEKLGTQALKCSVSNAHVNFLDSLV